MSETIQVRTEIAIPGGPTVIHIAQLEELENTAPHSVRACKMLKIIELAGDVISGAGIVGGTKINLAAEPDSIVPHPDTYADFPDISARRISKAEFDMLWLEATTKFPELS